MTSVRLWTVQTIPAWDRLYDTGVLRGDGRRVYGGHRESYDWMMEQMRKRIAGYRGGFPMWAWLEPRPDLRRKAIFPTGTRGVRVELSVDSSRILASDFGAWHCVLNNQYLALTESEYRQKSDSCSLAQKVASWDRIFDLPSLRRSRWIEGGDIVQVVLENITLSDVLSVRRFIAR